MELDNALPLPPIMLGDNMGDSIDLSPVVEGHPNEQYGTGPPSPACGARSIWSHHLGDSIHNNPPSQWSGIFILVHVIMICQ